MVYLLQRTVLVLWSSVTSICSLRTDSMLADKSRMLINLPSYKNDDHDDEDFNINRFFLWELTAEDT